MDSTLPSQGSEDCIALQVSVWHQPCEHSVELALVIDINWASVFCSSPPTERWKPQWVFTVPFQIASWYFITSRWKARFLGKALHKGTYISNFKIHWSCPQNTTVLPSPSAFLFAAASVFARGNPIHPSAFATLCCLFLFFLFLS